MSQQLILTLLPLVVVLVVLGIVLAIRPRLWRGIYAGTGLEAWRRIAAGLTWRERWALSWANTWGRPTRPALAALAVQRGEVVIACARAVSGRSSGMRKVWLALGVFALLLCLLNIGLLVAGERQWYVWLQVATQGGLAAMLFSMPALQNSDATRARRSVERNRELLAGLD